ncbi:phage tail sheath C-terminal domain-containing protein [Massilia sp. TS11]|uniref:phage tail sheath family protein n=1 Tax=Massilia sp. TS11 TaxID=2908003 RepID=UPI001EDB690A|nr:phage tail sheath C-terminal domain-containing protein [Massilia sp. TS11]MCG2584164.1 phage tail sheath family protein [Massilia sp. TS11]
MGLPTTPGVYINEIDGFSSSVVAVQTAVPVFIGYTEYAQNGNQNLTNVPMPISSMAEFQMYFADPSKSTNGAPQPQFTYVSKSTATPPYQAPASSPRFNLYYGMQMFFNNGGGNCYILSIGSYANAIANPPSAEDYAQVFSVLEQFAEPTMLVMPDAMLLDAADWVQISQEALMHCNKMQSRITIFDVQNGYYPPNMTSTDPIQGADGKSGFYALNGLGEDFNKYGAAYYPWINTNVVSKNQVDFTWFTDASLGQLQSDLQAEAPTLFTDQNKLQAYNLILNGVAPGQTPTAVKSTHQTVYNVSPLYQQTINNLLTSVNLMPPAAAMAGVYTRIDNTFGVFQAPANTTIINAVSPAVTLSDSQQGALNVPLNGLAVNAIRTFPNYGLLVWGARTMAGNSDDWRYISVRRTMIMLEQSIKYAMQSYVFQANDSVTWVAVAATINNFLNLQWKAGALVGSKPAEAYSVAVGLGQTMTGQDILDGVMNVVVKVAVVRPAEFIVLTFQQQMQTS